ncbi:ChaN family lipoprotein [Desulfogranum marinum]|uniref:ChaN family lipoprotein n=1 Tax=Desulfogranum marinum TaxID=453220 RepID=UPI0029C7D117|nr:ChaN family lipoprotein [Desulfogranum marinum]
MKNTLFIFIFLFFIFPSFLPCNHASANTMVAPIHHHISLSFDINKQTLYATSRISIPQQTELYLEGGPLSLTGIVLEKEKTTPVKVIAGEKNDIFIAASHLPQQLYISWELSTAHVLDRDNLIADNGITLAGFWHPLGKQDMLFSLDAVIPQHFSAITEAEEITTTVSGSNKHVHASFNHPLQSMHLIAGPYVIQSKQLQNLTIYAYFFKEDAHLMKQYLAKTASYIREYENLIGPFPYSRYSIVENRLPTGYGMPGFTLLGQAVVRLPFIVDTSLGHEILHSWFGNSIFIRHDDGNWAEGLTTYLADQHLAAKAGKDIQYRKKQLVRYDAYVAAGTPPSMRNFHNPSDNQPQSSMLRAVGYDKGSMIFHMLHQKIGRDNFFKALALFYQTNRFQRAGWQDIQDAFAEVSDTNLAAFFDQWVDREDIPSLSIEKIDVKPKGGQASVAFDIVQHTEKPYAIDVPIRIETMGEPIQKTLTTNSTQKRFAVTTDTLPVSITLDPKYDLMRSLGAGERRVTWAHFLAASPMNILVSEKQAATYQPLINLLQKRGGNVISPKNVTNSALQKGSWLFAGASSHRSSLFADKKAADFDFSLAVHPSPFHQRQVMVLVDSEDFFQTQAVAGKLFHYGQYSVLGFNNGNIQQKKTSPADDGDHYPLLSLPGGVPTKAPMDFSEILTNIKDSKVIYVGETHTDYGAHLLQLQIIQGLFQLNPNLVIGMEMFPTSSQQALDDYIDGTIQSESEFIKQSQYFKVWGYDYRLYRDIIGFAKAKKIPLIGLNLDKQITRTLYRTGTTDALSVEQRASVPEDRDLILPGYEQRLTSVFKMHQTPHSSGGFPGFLQAQALWDETMATSIINILQQFPEKQIIVLAGTGHVHKINGIPPRVQRRMNNIAQKIIVPAGRLSSDAGMPAPADILMDTASVELAAVGKIGVILEEEENGQVRIRQISPHGLAGKAGLMPQDIIKQINNNPVASVADIKISLLDTKAGDTVSAQIIRGEKLYDFQVELSSIQQTMMPKAHPKIKMP